jgi:hypothetical protein
MLAFGPIDCIALRSATSAFIKNVIVSVGVSPYIGLVSAPAEKDRGRIANIANRKHCADIVERQYLVGLRVVHVVNGGIPRPKCTRWT